MSALLDAQSQSGATAKALDPSQALQDLYSQIDTNGDGQITKSEFENALGAGGTNLAMADDVFNKLDTNSDGTVSLNELKSALQGAGHHHGGHHPMADIGGADGADGSNADPLLQALDGASSSSVSNSDGTTTTTITYADGSKVTMTTPASSTGTSSSRSGSSSASSSYSWIEQMIQREAQALSAQAASSVTLSA
jgi:Ca2+-binding EF-hand superfamily protein